MDHLAGYARGLFAVGRSRAVGFMVSFRPPGDTGILIWSHQLSETGLFFAPTMADLTANVLEGELGTHMRESASVCWIAATQECRARHPTVWAIAKVHE